MARIKLQYGRKGIETFIPDECQASVFSLKDLPPVPEPGRVLGKRLKNPAGSRSLEELAENASGACVVVSDKTRYVPYRVLLPEILPVLEKAGTDVFFLTASGMHRPSSRDDIAEILGPDIPARYRVVNHDAGAGKDMVFLGEGASTGVPVFVNREYYEAELKILTGFIEPHFMAGFSGGRKSLCPGLSGIETIKFVHSPEILSHPLAKAGRLEGNPCSEAMFEAARMAGCDFIVHVTLTADREISGVFCGDMEEAFFEGVEL